MIIFSSAPDTCTCTSSWTGATCNTRKSPYENSYLIFILYTFAAICLLNCSNGGTCVSTISLTLLIVLSSLLRLHLITARVSPIRGQDQYVKHVSITKIVFGQKEMFSSCVAICNDVCLNNGTCTAPQTW